MPIFLLEFSRPLQVSSRVARLSYLKTRPDIETLNSLEGKMKENREEETSPDSSRKSGKTSYSPSVV